MPKKLIFTTFYSEEISFDIVNDCSIEQLEDELKRITNIQKYMDSLEPNLFKFNIENYKEFIDDFENKKSYFKHPIIGVSSTETKNLIIPTYSISHKAKFLHNAIELGKTDMNKQNKIQFFSNIITFNKLSDLDVKAFTPEQNFNMFKSYINVIKELHLKNILLIKKIVSSLRK